MKYLILWPIYLRFCDSYANHRPLLLSFPDSRSFLWLLIRRMLGPHYHAFHQIRKWTKYEWTKPQIWTCYNAWLIYFFELLESGKNRQRWTLESVNSVEWKNLRIASVNWPKTTKKLYEVKKCVVDFIDSKNELFFLNVIRSLRGKWRKYVDANGEYF